MYTITQIRQTKPTSMLVVLHKDSGEMLEQRINLDHGLRIGSKVAKLTDLGGGVCQKLAYTPIPPTLIEALTATVNSIEFNDDALVVDCTLSDGINTLLYPLGGIKTGDTVYRDNEGNVYTLATAKERIACSSLLCFDIELP